MMDWNLSADCWWAPLVGGERYQVGRWLAGGQERPQAIVYYIGVGAHQRDVAVRRYEI